MTNKAFRITDGKGFSITLPNEYTVSVQFGPGNYGDHYHAPFGSDYKSTYQFCGQLGSDEVETAITGPDGEFVQWQDDDVQGYQTVEQVLETIKYAASL
jgi:hypothetical protein